MEQFRIYFFGEGRNQHKVTQNSWIGMETMSIFFCFVYKMDDLGGHLSKVIFEVYLSIGLKDVFWNVINRQDRFFRL